MNTLGVMQVGLTTTVYNLCKNLELLEKQGRSEGPVYSKLECEIQGQLAEIEEISKELKKMLNL